MKGYLTLGLLLVMHCGYSQSQECPPNIDWSSGTLTHWYAYTGNNLNGNGPFAVKDTYDSIYPAPAGTIGAPYIHEYQQSDSIGIKVITTNYQDAYGLFPVIPTINGYPYSAALRLGSSLTDIGLPNQGGFVRGVGYTFDIPPGPATEPYTLTYAYALVMDDGFHPNNQQPQFSVMLMAGDSVVSCASPDHYLPTTANGTLDTPNAKLQGFFPTWNVQATNVWAKAWTEVAIDLAQYRGQQVSLIFETDNCVPGAHFAYSYIAIRNNCAVGMAAPVITGDTVVCSGMPVSYSVPTIKGQTYNWIVPPGWTVLANGSDSTVRVQTGNTSGTILLNTQYSCDNFQSSLQVVATPPTIAGPIDGGTEVCTGINSAMLTSGGNAGSVVGWLATTDGAHYTLLNDTTLQYLAQDLDTSTTFRALIQNGPTCAVDTSSSATVVVDQPSSGGKLSPADLQFCEGRNTDATLSLTGQTGEPVNWQVSPDSVAWSGVAPVDTTALFIINNLTASAFYRVLVRSGVCPADTSMTVKVNYIDVPYPQVSYSPADTLICYGASAVLRAEIGAGTNYTWSNTGSLTDAGNGTIDGVPDLLQPVATPRQSTAYVLSVENAGCPNILRDTFAIGVRAPIPVFAGDDTSVVVGQPLQLNARSVDTSTAGGDRFTWAPATGLNNSSIADPVALYPVADSIRYLVTATASDGCTGTGGLLVKVYGTGAGIFVPNAFTPGGVANGIFRPVTVGITGLGYFRVYNRWGQLVYETTGIGEGWDGRIDGHLAETGPYVWVVQGRTYTGEVITHRGTMILIR